MTDKSVVQFQKLLGPIWKSLDQVNKRLVEINKKQDQHTGALVSIEDTIKIYGDMYQVNNDNAKKLERRVNKLEDVGGVTPPPELRLIDF